jgi:U3 small nucleolar RNA-associated protein 4
VLWYLEVILDNPKQRSVLIFTGPDASPTVLPLRQFGMENQRQLPFLPQDPTVRSAAKERLLMSFWDREIHIWRLNKPQSTNGVEELDSEQSRKLVAKVLIKGEANITSAALSADGNFLAAATTTDIKLFQLKSRTVEDSGLRITKVPVPSSFSSGARHIEFSPDERWLCIIRPDSRIVLARLLASTSSASLHPQLSKLPRIDRQIEKHILLGGLGSYDRTITQVAFSSDSRILAISDLAGYIDTFVLSGQEDLNQAPPAAVDDAASLEDASDSEDSDLEDGSAQVKLISGQHWTRNPSAFSLPRLPSAVTILSFRPSTVPLTNGTATHVITTRRNPHPIPHDLPTGEDRLLVVTATGDIFEFEVLKGALSPWSRRNPTTNFPEEFRRIRDQARGCIWDVNAVNERVWIYGAGWLWMFDLSQDLPHKQINGETSSKKRKRGKESASGAGSMIPDKELGTGISRKMQRIIHEEVDETEDVPFHDKDTADADSDVDGESMALERLRRGDEEEVVTNGDTKNTTGRPWWRTFKYRPILGICAIGEQGEGDIGPEVAIVERPIWEADLGPRYFGDQEWEKGSL